MAVRVRPGRADRASLTRRFGIGNRIFAALVTAAAIVVVLLIVGLFYELISRSMPSIRFSSRSPTNGPAAA